MDAEKITRELWHMILTRIRHMSDYKDGTHAQLCIKDISKAITSAVAEKDKEIREIRAIVFDGNFDDYEVRESLKTLLGGE